MFYNFGILGINARNLLYIRPYNRKKAIRLADSKLKTKHFLSARGIRVPKLFFVIKNREELEKFDFSVLPSSFVLKPNFGYGGEGIIPIVAKEGGFFFKPSGERLGEDDLYDHIGDILDGRFSISNMSDIAFFEQRIICDEIIGRFAYKGLPDIRVVVHNLIPVLAMLRLPTKESDGKANLHQGAIGVGIDIARGQATHILKGNKIVNQLSGMEDISRLKIPYWDEILLMCSNIQLITNLGYMAVDVVLDKLNGPTLLEINARAGLGVQLANLVPLRRRLERIQGVKVLTPEKGVRIAKDMFGDQIERGVKNISGKQVVGSEENVTLILKEGNLKVLAQVNSGIDRTVMDRDYALKNGIFEDSGEVPEKFAKMQFVLAGLRLKTIVDFTDLGEKRKYKMIIGKRDLGQFYIDPTRVLLKKQLPKESENFKKKREINFHEVDSALVSLDARIKLLYHLRPLNLKEEEEKFLKEFTYNPQFLYPDLKFNPYELKSLLKSITIDDSVLGIIMDEKRQEILKKIELLESIGTEEFTENSIRLFGVPSGGLAWEAEQILKNVQHDDSDEEPTIGHEEAVGVFEKALRDYNLYSWSVKIKRDMVTNCVAGKKNTLFLKEGALFTRKYLDRLIVHEIETHILTAENGKSQPYQLFNRGLFNYLITQEGLAIYNQESRGFSSKRYLMTALAVYYALRMSFAQVVDRMIGLGMSVSEAFHLAVKAKRGFEDTSLHGAFTKDFIYFKGYKEIENFVFRGGDLKKLYIGKINWADLDLIEKIPGIKEPKYLPKWLE